MPNFYTSTALTFRDGVSANLKKLPRAVLSAAQDAVLAGAEIIREAAYNNANVSPGVVGHCTDGGHMRDKIEVGLVSAQSDQIARAKIGIDLSICPYAPHQEFGLHGNAFMRRALDEHRDEVRGRMIITFNLSMRGKMPVGTSVKFRSIA